MTHALGFIAQFIIVVPNLPELVCVCLVLNKLFQIVDGSSLDLLLIIFFRGSKSKLGEMHRENQKLYVKLAELKTEYQRYLQNIQVFISVLDSFLSIIVFYLNISLFK